MPGRRSTILYWPEASVTGRRSTQFRSNTPQLFLEIDRDKVEALGVPLADVNQTLQIYLGSSSPTDFNAFGRHWQVTLQASGEFRSEIADIDRLEVRNSQGSLEDVFLTMMEEEA